MVTTTTRLAFTPPSVLSPSLYPPTEGCRDRLDFVVVPRAEPIRAGTPDIEWPSLFPGANSRLDCFAGRQNRKQPSQFRGKHVSGALLGLDGRCDEWTIVCFVDGLWGPGGTGSSWWNIAVAIGGIWYLSVYGRGGECGEQC